MRAETEFFVQEIKHISKVSEIPKIDALYKH